MDARQIPNLPEYRIKIDPGADTDGISIIHDNEILFAMHIQHRGRQVTENMTKRKGNRKNRRNRETRYLKVLHAVGFDKDLLKICADDPLGRLLQDERDNRYAREEQ